MSMAARQLLVSRLLFQKDSQRTDLLDPNLTQTELIALLLELTERGFYLEVTAVRSDHRDDSGLGTHSHANGYCADLWPLRSRTAGDYVDADSRVMALFLRSCAGSGWTYQIGLAGTAYLPANMEAAGSTAFQDDGLDHIHLGAI